MDIATVIIAVLALVVSLGAANFARIEATSARTTAKFDEQRRLEERTPVFDIVQGYGGTSEHWLDVYLRRPEYLPAVALELLPNSEGTPQISTLDAVHTVQLGSMQVDRASRIDRVEQPSEPTVARFAAHCQGEDGEKWRASVVVTLQASPAANIDWLVEHLNGKVYILRNIGPVAAVGVRIKPHPRGNIGGHGADGSLTIGVHDSCQFGVIESMQSAPPTSILVTWSARPTGVVLPLLR